MYRSLACVLRMHVVSLSTHEQPAPIRGSELADQLSSVCQPEQSVPRCAADAHVQQQHPLISPQQQGQQQDLQWRPNLGQRQEALMHVLVVLQQPCRSFTTSAGVCGKKQGPQWVQPQLHQPMKHVSGTDPLRVPRAAAGATVNQPNSSTQPVQDPREHPDSSSSRVGLAGRLRAAAARHWQSVCTAGSQVQAALPWRTLTDVGMKCAVCVTAAVSVYLIVRHVVIGDSLGNIRNSDPTPQRIGVQRLRSLLRWEWGSDLAYELVSKGVLGELAGLVKPGTDAMLLNEVFALLDELLVYGDSMAQAMRQVGLLDVVSNGLQEGWLPRGAVDAAQTVQKKLLPVTPEPHQKRRLPPVKQPQ